MEESWSGSTVLTSKKRGDLQSLAREAAASHRVVVACGGDGTVREVASGLMNTGAALGVIPLGSGNDFAKMVKLPGDLEKALAILKKRRTVFIDVGRCNRHYFFNTLGIGFDGMTSYHAGRLQQWRGAMRYILAALKTNLKMDPVEITAEFNSHRIDQKIMMLTAANGRVEGGSFVVAPEAEPDDGLLDIVMIDPISKWILPLLLPLFLTGRQSMLGSVHTYRTDEIRISLERPMMIHADGEMLPLDNAREIHIEIMPGAMQVVAGPDY